MGARPIEHGRKVGTKAKQILPMLSKYSTQSTFPIAFARDKKKIRAPRIPFSHWKKKVKLFHKRARSPHYNPRGIPFSKEKFKSTDARAFSLTKGSDHPR